MRIENDLKLDYKELLNINNNKILNIKEKIKNFLMNNKNRDDLINSVYTICSCILLRKF